MKLRTRFLLAATLTLVLGLGSGLMAQSGLKGSKSISPPQPLPDVVTLNAIEISDGTAGFDAQFKEETVYGYSFLGRTSGSLPGSFTLSMNCSPATAVPGGTSILKGGAWTLPVYNSAIRGALGYAGSLYGTIAEGTMSWDKDGRGAQVYLVLKVDGGTQTWQGVAGYATFAGTLSYDEKAEKTALNGDLVFNMLNAFAK